MEHKNNDGKRKNTILSYYTKKPKLSIIDNLNEGNKLVNSFKIVIINSLLIIKVTFTTQ